IALFEFNLALVIDDQGKINEAIALEKKILRTFQIIIECAHDDELIHKAKQREAGVIANLAAFYNNIGYVDRAYEMIKYSYEKKKALYDSADPNLASVLTRIAGAEVSLRLFDKALATTNLAFTNLQKAPENYPAIEAELYYMMAKSYEGKRDITMARRYFDKSETMFQTAYPQDYSRAYLTMLKNYSQFLAQNGFNEFAFAKAEKVYNYVKNNATSDNITSLNALSNLASIRFKTKNYEQSLLLATEGNAILDQQLKTAGNKLDSIQIGYRRPAFTSLAVASRYALEIQKSPTFLKQQIAEINKAVEALERRRSTSTADSDVETLLEDYGALNELSKKLHYDLYTQTSDTKLLDKLLTLQESGVYHRIRTQLNARDEIRFNKVPAKILKREKALKEALSLKDMDADFDMATYFKREQEWNGFLTDLKKQYPDYYSLKYATLQVPIADLQNNIPDDTTMLRYFFMEEELFVFVISKS
ncbi:MAG: hypothetical protein NWQ19_10720, partial [Nonlabens sp.]|nr:hypothetical protein [Nonlabens sp.]